MVPGLWFMVYDLWFRVDLHAHSPRARPDRDANPHPRAARERCGGRGGGRRFGGEGRREGVGGGMLEGGRVSV